MPAHALSAGAASRTMDVVLCWHMHQPDYRLAGRYLKPWTWLHAIKDYTDMAAHLERIQGARAVVNFSPVLIEQLQDYPQRIRACIGNDEPVGDLLLDALAAEDAQADPDLVAQLVRVNEQRMKVRFGPYARLFERADSGEIDVHDVADLLVWYVIAWLGESLRDLSLPGQLVAKQSGFTIEDRRALLTFVADVIDEILPRYGRLMSDGAVELSVTPYAHPIVPLLIDFESTRDANPEAPLPDSPYPGGADRCHWHVAEARRVFVEAFGAKPAGCWPSEGAISDATLALLRDHGFEWTASGSQVLHHSLQNSGLPVGDLAHLHPWRQPGKDKPACFFRDDGLSDLIGFEYSKWRAADAVDDLVGRLEQLSAQAGDSRPVLSIIMDGENAWEYFPENGWDFLQGLYTRLAEHPQLNLTTFSEVIARTDAKPLPAVCAGSWVHGSLATWIGDEAKNRAWDLLCAAKRAVDAALQPLYAHNLPRWAGDVLRQLAICEASDWFWWPGGENPLADAPAFDALFRRQLSELYRMIGMAPPAALERPLGEDGNDVSESPSQGQDVVGAMRRSTAAPN